MRAVLIVIIGTINDDALCSGALVTGDEYSLPADEDMEFLIFLCVIAAHTLSQRQAVLSVEVRIQVQVRAYRTQQLSIL